MTTRLMKTTARGAWAALFGSAGLVLFLAVGVQGGGTASPGGQDGAIQCSNATVQGTYGLNIQGTRPVPPPLGGGTETVIGVVLRTYDGTGNFTQIDNVNGSVTGIEPDRPGFGTYQVNSNCTAVTHVEPAPGLVIEERMVIMDGGGEIRSITASPQGVMVTALSRRINDSHSRLANTSTRGVVHSGDDAMIGGTIIVGSSPTTVVLRAIGPSLTSSGVPGVLQDPTLELHDGSGAWIASNDNWRSDQEAEIIAAGLAPSNDAESAILKTLNPGAYTAIVRGTNGTAGVGLVEAFQLDN